jgi:hypothetical protein
MGVFYTSNYVSAPPSCPGRAHQCPKVRDLYVFFLATLPLVGAPALAAMSTYRIE